MSDERAADGGGRYQALVDELAANRLLLRDPLLTGRPRKRAARQQGGTRRGGEESVAQRAERLVRRIQAELAQRKAEPKPKLPGPKPNTGAGGERANHPKVHTKSKVDWKKVKEKRRKAKEKSEAEEKKRLRREGRSVWTVSGGLPGLNRRRK